MRNLIVIFFLHFSLWNFSQEITNIHFVQEGKMINIYYDLTGEGNYEVKVYCSQDGGNNWGNPLIQVTGAVGKDLNPGVGKKIIWDVLVEKEALQGDIKFKVEALSPDFTDEAGTFIDIRDRKTYKWVKIGNQIWMAENLNFSKGVWSRCYDDKNSNCITYGRLYNWKTAKNACPAGWYLPSDAEWMTLITSLGDESFAGGKMKESGTQHWIFPNTNATNESGFTALPGGAVNMNIDGDFDGIGKEGHFWSSYKSDVEGALEFRISYNDDDLKNEYQNTQNEFSVRCVKD